jgi:hypothetical protein
VISSGNDDFWQMYYALPEHVRVKARHAYQLFLVDPDHPSLRFKKLHSERNIWSVRFGDGYRAICERNGENVEWFWIGTRQAFGKEF